MSPRPTRRDVIKYGGIAGGAGMLAGCTGNSEQTPEPGDESTETPTATETATPEDEGYSATIAPMGEVEFDAVPEDVVVYDPQWADHLVALGQQDRIVSLGFPDFYFTGYYDELPGVSFDTSNLTKLWNGSLDKEIFYELDGDIHHIDPCRFTSFESGMDRDDFEEIEENVSPFFANRFSRAHSEPPKWCRDSYEYYTLWELLDKYAEVYQTGSRSEALLEVRDGMLESIYAELPPESERPEVGLIAYNPDEESFSPYKLNAKGFGKAHTRPLRARDSFANSDRTYAENYEATYDMEAMLEIDPDVLLHNFDWVVGTEGMYDRTKAFFNLDEHPVGKELTAVKNDRLYATGTGLQGPIMNLFQIELSAKQIYPELFGEAPEPGDTSGLGDLFDVERVADIVKGDI